MLLLALDTSTSAVTVALHDGADVLAELTDLAGAPRHAEVLAPAIEALVASVPGCSLDQVTDVAVGVGPGPFTGLRIGLVTARVLGTALGVPVHGICSLDVLAADATCDGEFVVVTDARRREVYWARYRSPLVRLSDPAVDRPAAVAAAGGGVRAVGEGTALYPDAFPRVAGPERLSAGTLARLVVDRLRAGEPTLPPDPLYLRRPDATPAAPRKPVTAS